MYQHVGLFRDSAYLRVMFTDYSFQDNEFQKDNNY